MDYRKIIESKYNRQNWQGLLHDIFRQNIEFWETPIVVNVDNNVAKSALYIGKITLLDGNVIAVYEVELGDSVKIERNRAGIRNLLCSNWRSIGCAGAFMFCYRKEEAVLRFSYVSESFAFSEDGSLTKESTDTKRFTYLLGEGHRSRTAISQFEKLRDSELSLKDITKAFSIEALSDLFFREYKKQYEDIIEYITGKRMVKVANKWEEQTTGQPCSKIMNEFAKFENAEKAVRDYVKKLMGRLVFIQFLQKKGWMGCSAGESWSDGDKEFVQTLFANTKYKDTFIDDVLEPLFNDINTRRKDDLVSDIKVGANIKVPYLNGGLFEYDEYDKATFALPAKYMKNLLDFFASYNFTIDENDPDDAEIGVDPEMLGRIFENLLEDNKDKGAFYTPKEIVRYMCRESLIAYIQTDVEDEDVKNRIREFVSSHDITALNSSEVFKVDKKLRDVKICDPAIGSGAFPMGLLKELFDCRMAIEGTEEGKSPAAIKKDIIQNSIYGVDIEKGAVDIARLRFWLALIVDEDHPHALPNMDFKIMQGNSLLEQYEGVDLSGMSVNEQIEKKGKKGDLIWRGLEFDEKDSLKNIQHDIRDYYNTDNHAKKVELRKSINSSIKNYIRSFKGCTPEIQKKIDSLRIPNDKFFLWHIYFKEVFDNGGFDIVIGNPPYIQLQAEGGALGNLYKSLKFESFAQTGDIYCLFYEHGVNILRDKGILCYITSNKWMRAAYGLKTSDYFIKRTNPKLLIDFAAMQIFENATVETNILLLSKEGYTHKTKCFIGTNEYKNVLSQLDSYVKEKSSIMDFKIGGKWVILEGSEAHIQKKISEHGIALSDWDIKVNFGIKTGFNDAFIISTEKRDDILANCANNNEREITKRLIMPVVRGRDIQRYYSEWNGTWLIGTFPARKYNINDFPSVSKHILSYGMERVEQSGKKYIINGQEVKARKKTKHSWFETQDPIAYWDELNYNKLIWKRIGSILRFSYDSRKSNVLDSCCFATGEHLEYLCCVLNSKMGHYLLKDSPKTGTGDLLISVQAVEPIKVPKPDTKTDEKFKYLLGQILSAKQSNPQADTTSLEAEIDRLVYELYGLTEEEIAIVEGKE